MNYVPFAPTIIGETILSDISIDLIQQYKIYLDNLEYITSYSNTHKGTLNQQVLNDPSLSKLKVLILKQSKEYLKSLGFVFEDVKIINSWGTKLNFNGKSSKHIHSNSFISGVYYLEDSSNITFHDPLADKWMFSLKKTLIQDINRSPTLSYTPQPNSLILFPSYLHHEIEINEKNNRMSIAFNIIPTGELGDLTSIISL